MGETYKIKREPIQWEGIGFSHPIHLCFKLVIPKADFGKALEIICRTDCASNMSSFWIAWAPWGHVDPGK